MLKIRLKSYETFDDKANRFNTEPSRDLYFEHSLLSLSKWESITNKPFLAPVDKTEDEVILYIKCMLINEEDEAHLVRLREPDVEALSAYVRDSHTATTFSNRNQSVSREVITSELIYYWMITAQIPFSCETWNLSRLFTLIRVCGVKAQKPKKMSMAQLKSRNTSLNAARRAALGTTG